MVIKPGRSLQKKRVRHIAAPENGISKKRRLPLKQQPLTVRALSALQAGLRALSHNLKKKLLPIKRAAHTSRRARTARSIRYIVLTGSAAVITVAALLILLAPGGASEDAYIAANVTAFPTYSIPTPTAAPVSVTDPSLDPSAAAVTLPPTQKPSAPPPSNIPDMDSLVAFFCVKEDSYYSDFNYSSNHYDYTAEELQMMAKIIQAEAGGEPYEGKIAIGNVIINRTLCGHWGSTMADQTKGLAYNPDKVPSAASLSAARAVLDYEIWVVPQSTYNFKTSGGAWRSFTLWGQIGHHYFYTYHYGSRYDGDSIPPALYKRVFKYAQFGCKPADRVKRIQYMLKSLGYKVTSDSYFGEATRKALIAFQQSKGLKADGVAGPATVEALIRAFGVEDYCKKYL